MLPRRKANSKLVKFLCTQGVDERAKNGGAATALELAKNSRRGAVVKYLESGQCEKK